ncbi:MAG: proline racemase family protein [Planctomycetaceae bacterium]
MQKIRVIDSHTGGEPTRIIIEGGPDLGPGSLADQRQRFRDQFDHVRSAVNNEPRGSDFLVGGLLCEPSASDCSVGVIFFNNAGYINMCGHGTIGLMVTLNWLGKLKPGSHRIDTPVGVVTATLLDDHRVALQNVPSYRFRKDVPVFVPGHGEITGDIAWGGNWFFLVSEHGQQLELSRASQLSDFTLRIRAALEAGGITGEDGGVIDHIELFSPVETGEADSRNFVMCPGGAYDRSPCGTGTSAKLACLAADGKLQAGQVWRQQSIVGSIFEGSFEPAKEADVSTRHIIPTIIGSAWVTGDCTFFLDPSDPFRAGIRS